MTFRNPNEQTCPTGQESAAGNGLKAEFIVASSASIVSPLSQGWRDSNRIPETLASDHNSNEMRWETECRQLDHDEWDAVVSRFQDANLFQTWAYAAARWGEKRMSHLLLKDAAGVVGAAQVVLIKLPGLRGGLAYVKWGPLWKAYGRETNPRVFRELFRVLRKLYAQERGFLLRVSPWEFDDPELRSIPGEEGFRQNSLATQQTAVLDLTYSLEELRSSLSRHWRANLKRAESNGLEVIEGVSEELLQEFAALYRQLRARKGKEWIPPVHYLPQIQRALDPEMKPFIAICRHNGKPAAGLIATSIGEKAFAWLAATGDGGQELRGSYFLQWHMIQRLKLQGARVYDLGGINEITHPGTTQFKLGLCGKKGRTASYLGEFETCDAWASRWIVGGTDRFRQALLRFQQFCEENWQALRKPGS